jgi:hypothetical protein
MTWTSFHGALYMLQWYRDLQVALVVGHFDPDIHSGRKGRGWCCTELNVDGLWWRVAAHALDTPMLTGRKPVMAT